MKVNKLWWVLEKNGLCRIQKGRKAKEEEEEDKEEEEEDEEG
jgi:hypothetical protein